ncbi:MAG: molybdopterin-dependent oxidoreductase [Methylotenera sp.]|nr:molybdopterin-dependent oxidoreductase [Methylotenera sp.]
MPNRRKFFNRLVAGTGMALLTGCDKLSNSKWFTEVLSSGESLSKHAHHLIANRKSMAQEFSEKDLSPDFRSNGTALPNNAEYQVMANNAFEDWKLTVGGLVVHAQAFTMADLQALPSRTQITRHDCVEGWSAIGKWTGVPLHEVLSHVKPLKRARYVMFYCADPMAADGTKLYYESIDLDDAYHPQTMLAYQLNDKTLPIKNGAPIRLRVERQLGYKQAKYIMRIELVDTFDHIAGGKGGYWEDSGYEWYAGI